MTPTETLLPQGRGMSGAPPATNPNGGQHSTQCAAKHLQYCDRFDQFWATVEHPSGSTSEYEGWNLNIELSSLDKSILSEEQQALEYREQKAVVPRIGHLATTRPDGIWRSAYCQLNNISGRETLIQKIKGMERIACEFDVNGITL